MKKAKRVLCLILCLATLLAVSAPALAASPVSEIQSRLVKMAQTPKYRDASYTAFDSSLGSGCYAFVRALSKELFGTGIPSQKRNSAGRYALLDPSTNQNWYEIGVATTNEQVKTLLRSAQPGDIIQFSSQSMARHIVMVYSVSAEGICLWGAGKSKGAHFSNYKWENVAGPKVGFGDFTGGIYALSLYRCKKDVKTGEIDGSTTAAVSVTFSDYQVRKLTATSAEPYAAVTATGGLVGEVGMYIGTSPNELTKLGSDNSTPKAKKIMWYNTIPEKYDYPLEAGTTYYYQPYAVVNSKPYYGSVKSFTTPRGDGTTNANANTDRPISDGTYTLTPKCAPSARLDVSGGSKLNKANIQIYKANNTASQQFTFTCQGDGYYTIKATVSGKLLDVANGDTASKTNVWQYTANGSKAQLWKLESAGDGYYYIIPALNTGLCLDVYNGAGANKTNVWVYTRNQSNAQKWLLTKV